MNEQQLACVTSTANQVVVVASPGSGKTRTLIECVARRALRDGPQTICCITYTNAGANEMRQRLHRVAPEDGGPIRDIGYIGTLHAFLLRLLRQNHRLAGLPAGVTVVDSEVRIALLEDLMESTGTRTPLKQIEAMIDRPKLIEGRKGVSYTRDELVVVEYHRQLIRNGLLDLDALLHHGLALITKIKDTKAAWPFLHLFVDESQDSANIDFEIYRAMPVQTRFVVGDPDQAIYGFRGGDVDNIVHLAQAHDWEKHQLEANYRCQDEIAKAAQRLIEHNEFRVKKGTYATTKGGTVGVRTYATPAEELNGVATEIVRFIDGASTPAWHDIAILARTNRRAKEFADTLRGQGLPVATDQLESLPVDWEIAKLVVAALAAPASDMVWLRLIRAVEGSDVAEAAKVSAAMGLKSVSAQIKDYDRRWREQTFSDLPGALLGRESLARLKAAAAQLEEGGLWDLADLSVLLRSGERGRGTPTPGITVTTLHSAKGREWGLVFIVGCEEGEIPQARADTDIEECRRLLFVGMTRARHTLHLSYCEARPQSRGPNLPPGPLQPREPSRFLKEILP